MTLDFVTEGQIRLLIKVLLMVTFLLSCLGHTVPLKIKLLNPFFYDSKRNAYLTHSILKVLKLEGNNLKPFVAKCLIGGWF